MRCMSLKNQALPRMNMKGLNTSSNKRSVNLQLLTRYVRRMNNGGNVHTFTKCTDHQYPNRNLPSDALCDGRRNAET